MVRVISVRNRGLGRARRTAAIAYRRYFRDTDAPTGFDDCGSDGAGEVAFSDFWRFELEQVATRTYPDWRASKPKNQFLAIFFSLLGDIGACQWHNAKS